MSEGIFIYLLHHNFLCVFLNDILKQVTLVINFDLPLTRNREPAFETYLHRVGRTGRFKRKGAAFNFINEWKSEVRLSK